MKVESPSCLITLIVVLLGINELDLVQRLMLYSMSEA